MLSEAVSEAQTSESRVSGLQDWINRVDELLKEYLENDTSIEDLPHDFQVRNFIFRILIELNLDFIYMCVCF